MYINHKLKLCKRIQNKNKYLIETSKNDYENKYLKPIEKQSLTIYLNLFNEINF